MVLWGITSVSDHGGEIVFGYFAFLVFLFVSLPLHLIGIPLIVYTGLKSKVHKPLFWQYTYCVFWLTTHIIIFSPFLFKEIPELVNRAFFTATHQSEIELSRTLQQLRQDPAKVKALIDAGVDVNEVDQYIGFPPIVWAARQGNVEIVEMLINAGAEVDAVIDKKANTGMFNEIYVPEVTALGFAAVSNDDEQRPELVRTILEYGADPNRGQPVLGACAFGDIESLQILLAAGAEVRSEDLNGNTCGHLAAYNGQITMLTYLLEQGYLRDTMSKHNSSPLDLALRRQQDETVLLLIRQGFRPRSTDSLQRFLDEEPGNTPIKQQIRELYFDNGDPVQR